MISRSNDPAVSLFLAERAEPQPVQPVRASFLDELSAAHGEVLRFSVVAGGAGPTALARKSPLRALELRN